MLVVNPTSVVSPIKFSDLLIINSVCVSPVSGILNVELSPLQALELLNVSYEID